jgi:hypothetical protein
MFVLLLLSLQFGFILVTITKLFSFSYRNKIKPINSWDHINHYIGELLDLADQIAFFEFEIKEFVNIPLINQWGSCEISIDWTRFKFYFKLIIDHVEAHVIINIKIINIKFWRV